MNKDLKMDIIIRFKRPMGNLHHLVSAILISPTDIDLNQTEITCFYSSKPIRTIHMQKLPNKTNC